MIDAVSAASQIALGVYVLGMVLWAKVAAPRLRNPRGLSVCAIGATAFAMLFFWLAYSKGVEVGAKLIWP